MKQVGTMQQVVFFRPLIMNNRQGISNLQRKALQYPTLIKPQLHVFMVESYLSIYIK